MRIAREALSDVQDLCKTGWGGVVGGYWKGGTGIKGLAAWPGLQAGQAASLPQRCAALGDAAGPWRHSSARHQLLLTLTGICLVQICVSALTAKSWGLSTVIMGIRSCRALASLPQVGMKEKGKGGLPIGFGGKVCGNSLLLSLRSTESCCFLNNGGYTYAFPAAQSHMGKIFSLTKPLLK